MAGTSVISMVAGLAADRLGVPAGFLIGGGLCIAARVVVLALDPTEARNVERPVV